MNMNIFDELNNKLQIIEETKVNLKELERSLCDITKTFKKYNEKEKIDIANYLYWNVPKMPAKSIANNILNIDIYKMRKIIKSIESDIKCETCNIPLIRKFRGDWNYQQHNCKKRTYVCDKCSKQEIIQENIKESKNEIDRIQSIKYLKALPYSDYLNTNHWKFFRKKFLKYSQYKCSICNSNNDLQVHHRTYKNRGHEVYKDVIVLCGNCHNLFHKKGGKIEKESK